MDTVKQLDAFGEPDRFGEIPVLPYKGTSGHSGSDTSEKRARRRDSSGATKTLQASILGMLADRKSFGVTWREYNERYGSDHGSISGALSNLHKAEMICRLKEIRNDMKVYVLPQYVNGRETEAQGRRKK